MNVWYEQLHLKQNPFTIKPTHDYSLHGKDRIYERILSSIEVGSITLVKGQYGSGKTSFLKAVINFFKGQKRVIYFSCNRLTSELDVDQLLYERGIVTKLFRIKSKQMILLLDEASNLCSVDYDNLEKYYIEGYFKSIVLVTHAPKDMAMPKSFADLLSDNTYTFDRLHKSHAINIVRERIGEHPFLTDEVIMHIYDKDKRIRSFLKNCDTFMRHMMQTKRKTATSKDVEKILSTHAY